MSGKVEINIFRQILRILRQISQYFRGEVMTEFGAREPPMMEVFCLLGGYCIGTLIVP